MKNFLKENWGVILLFVLIIGFLFWPVIFGGKIFPDKFAVMYHYPVSKFFNETLKNQNILPLMMPGYLSGFPVWLSQVSFFHPFFIIFSLFFDYINAYNWTIILNFLIGAIASYFLARNLKLSKAASTVVSLAYTLNQWNIGAGQIIGFASLIPVLPLLFLSILKISQGKKIYIAIGSLVLGLGLATALTQIMLYILTALFFFAVFLDFKPRIYTNNDCVTCDVPKLSNIWTSQVIKRFKTAWSFTIVIIMGLILASPWILPVLQFKNLTHRATANFFEMNWANSANFGDFFRFFYPGFDFGIITGRAPFYIGALAFFLAITAIVWLRKKDFVKFFIFLFLFSFFASFKYSPLMWAINQLPFFNLFRFPTKWMYLGNFALAFLTGFGFDYLNEIREKINFKRFVKWIGTFAAAITILLLNVNLIVISSRERLIAILKKYFDERIYGKTGGASLKDYHKIIEKKFDYIASNISLANKQVIISFIFIAAAAVFLYFYQKKGIYKNLAAIIMILNLTIIWKFDDIMNFLPKKLAAEPPKIAEFINEQKIKDQSFRVYRFFPPLRPTEYIDSGILDFEDSPIPKDTAYIETLESNTNALYGIDSIDGHEVLQNKRYSRVLSVLGAANAISDGSVYNWETIENWISKKLTLEDKLKIFQSEKNRGLLSMMNVKYILSPFEFSSPWKKVFETEIIKDAKSQKFYIYENPDVMPQVYFANKVEFIEEDEIKAFEALMKNKYFREKTLIEISNPNLRMESESTNLTNNINNIILSEVENLININTHRDSSATLQNDKIQIEEILSDYLKIVIKTSSPRWLVRSQNNLPNWEARIDAKPVQIYTANYIYQAVFVPEGEHEIEFKYPGLWGQFIYALKSLNKHQTKHQTDTNIR